MKALMHPRHIISGLIPRPGACSQSGNAKSVPSKTTRRFQRLTGKRHNRRSPNANGRVR